MYGNHFENIEDSIETFLMPKIMSLNNANFHFTSCNFSKRNMYLR
jgi:cytosolic carboxypeptidase protein 5